MRQDSIKPMSKALCFLRHGLTYETHVCPHTRTQTHTDTHTHTHAHTHTHTRTHAHTHTHMVHSSLASMHACPLSQPQTIYIRDCSVTLLVVLLMRTKSPFTPTSLMTILTDSSCSSAGRRRLPRRWPLQKPQYWSERKNNNTRHSYSNRNTANRGVADPPFKRGGGGGLVPLSRGGGGWSPFQEEEAGPPFSGGGGGGTVAYV